MSSCLFIYLVLFSLHYFPLFTNAYKILQTFFSFFLNTLQILVAHDMNQSSISRPSYHFLSMTIIINKKKCSKINVVLIRCACWYLLTSYKFLFWFSSQTGCTPNCYIIFNSLNSDGISLVVNYFFFFLVFSC